MKKLSFLAVLFACAAAAAPPALTPPFIPGGGGDKIAGSCTEIITELQTCDTDDSGLNADTIDSLEGTSLITTSTTSNTTTLTMNVAGNDYTCASGTACRVFASGAANLELGAGGGRIDLTDSAGTVRAGYLNAVSSNNSMYFMADGGGAWQTTANGTFIGYRLGVTNTQMIGGIAKTIASDFTNVPVLALFGNGKWTLLPETATCADNGNGVTQATLTYDSGSGNCRIVNNDPQGCDITLAETSAQVNEMLDCAVITNAGGSVKILDSLNVVVATTFCDTTGLGVGGRVECDYIDAANDYWDCNCF